MKTTSTHAGPVSKEKDRVITRGEHKDGATAGWNESFDKLGTVLAGAKV